MRVVAALSEGRRLELDVVEMTPDWTLRAAAPGRGDLTLHLQAVLPCEGDLLYLFAPDELLFCGAAAPLPPLAAELLLYAPLVALARRPEGLQALSWTAWEALVARDRGEAMQVSAADSLVVPSEEVDDGADLEGSERTASDAETEEDEPEEEEPSDVEEELSEDEDAEATL